MEINQTYKAPSIPKISRRNIKSSVFSGATTSQITLKKSSFSFVKSLIKPKISSLSPSDLQAPETEVKESPSIFGLGQILDQTNKILLDVKKQLSLDFLNRIFNEKKNLENEKKKIASKKVADKEARIEKGGKGILGKSLEKVTAPFRSIFDKLIDFFSIIFTGILVNNAFIWLSDKNNQKKLTELFNFIKDYWQELLIIFAAYKLAKLVGVIFGIGLKLKKILQWFKNFKFPKKPSTPTTTRPTPSRPITRPTPTKPTISPQSSPLLNSQGQPLGGPIKPSGPLVTPSGTPLRQAYPLAGQKPFKAPSIPKGPPPKLKPITKLPSGLGGSGGGRGAGAFAIASSLYGLTVGPEVMKQRVSKLKELKKTNPQEYKKEIQKLKEIAQIEAPLSYIGYPVETISILESLGEKYKTFISPLGMSRGGTVGQGDRPGVDMVPAMTRSGQNIRLDQGEEVIKASESMRWRPLLKDVNDNGAKMWQEFTKAIRRQEEVNTVETGNTDNFSEILENYEKILKDEEKRLRQKYIKSIGGTTTTDPPAPPPAPTLPTSGASGSAGAPPTAPAPAPATSPSGSATPPAPIPASTPVMPDASKPGASGAPGIPGAPKIGDTVGELTPKPIKPAQTPKPIPRSQQVDSSVTPVTPVTPGTPGTPGPTSLPVIKFNPDTSFNYKNYFSNSAKLEPNNLQKSFEKPNNLLSSLPSSSVSVINMPLPPITVDNRQPGSIPAPSGNPTPLPNISSVNPLYEEEIALTAVTLGILV